MVSSSLTSPTNFKMTEQEIYDIYVLQSRNVRYLKKVHKGIIRDVNSALKKNDKFKADMSTKLLALHYSVLSEAQFIQILFTPKTFSFSQIQVIKGESSIVEKWKKMIDIAMDRVGDWNTDQDFLDQRNELHNIIDIYIKEPQGLRNKMAHGQWIHALNSNTTKENIPLTIRLGDLNVVEIQIWANVHQYLAAIIRDLIQSPQENFLDSYLSNLSEFRSFILESQTWTIGKRISRLQKKIKKEEI